MSRETGQQNYGRGTSFSEKDLKICDLCGGLNLTTNPECFVCGWHGHFENSPDLVHAAVELAVRKHGRLELQHLTDMRTYRPSAGLDQNSPLKSWFHRLWSWLRGE